MPLPIKRVARWLPGLALFAGTVLHAQAPLSEGIAFDPRQASPPERPVTKPIQDEVGYAGVMAIGERDTAPGEMPTGGGILAIHRTMPSGSYAEVTSLATGRTILVRVAGQGVLPKERVIDLSCAAVRQLGLSAMPAPIRIRRVSPPGQEQAVLTSGNAAAERMPSPPGLLAALRRKLPPAPRPANGSGEDCGLSPAAGIAPPVDGGAPIFARPGPAPKLAPAPKPVKPAKPNPALAVKVTPQRAPPPSTPPPSVAPPPAVAKGPGFAIQVAALSNRARANSLAKSLGGHVVVAGGIFRIRKGPYATEAAARAALPQIRAKGFADARVITNEGR